MSDGIKVGRTYRPKGFGSFIVTVLYIGRIDITHDGFIRSIPAAHYVRHADRAVITAMPTSEFLEKFELEEVEG